MSITYLIIFRGVQGFGAGSTENMVNIILGDIFPLEKRGFYGGMFDLVWASSGLFGPMIGGGISQISKNSWRWCFFINLPIGGLAFCILVFSLKLNKRETLTIKQVWNTFDKIGYSILFSGIILFLFGFVSAEQNGFQDKKVICFIVIGSILFCVFALFECFVQKYYPDIQPIIPSKLFRNRTTLLMFFGDICRALTLMATIYYLPVYYCRFGGNGCIKESLGRLYIHA